MNGEVEEGARVGVADGGGGEGVGGLGAVGGHSADVEAALDQLEEEEGVERGEGGPASADGDELALLHTHAADGGAGADVDGPVGWVLWGEEVGLLVRHLEALGALLAQRADARLHALGEAVAAELGPVDADVGDVVGSARGVGQELRRLGPSVTIFDCAGTRVRCKQ